MHRQYLILALLAALALAACPLAADAQAVRVRVAAANLTSGNNQSYEAPGQRILQGLQPDVVLIQEFNTGDNSTGATDAFVLSTFGPGFSWYRESGDEAIPNGIVSRWPIVEAGQWNDPLVNDRDFAWARIDLPGDMDLWAVSLHLLTSSPAERDAEAAILSDFIDAIVPPEDYLVVGGDLNTDDRTEPAITTLGAHVVAAGPYPVDQNGNGNTNRNRNRPYDWVLADADLHALHTILEIGVSAYPQGLVFDSRVYTPLTDVAPVQPEDSDADNMQHMAVVRDYLLPAATDFTVAPGMVDYGIVDAAAGPFVDSSVQLTVTNPFDLLSVAFSGASSGEFRLTDPDAASLPDAVAGNRSLVFTWSPLANDGVARSVAADLATSGNPAAFRVTLEGIPRTGAVGTLDVSGFRIDQVNGSASITLPEATVLDANGILVIGRDADRAAFESFWGPMNPAVGYLDGMAVTGDNGFPVINGGEQYRVRDAAGAAHDPATGYLPTTAAQSGSSYERVALDAPAFTRRAADQATPGSYAGLAGQTGGLRVAEISDALGSGNYLYEFVELVYDAAPVPAERVTLSLY